LYPSIVFSARKSPKRLIAGWSRDRLIVLSDSAVNPIRRELEWQSPSKT
jgi:hypothetical protein